MELDALCFTIMFLFLSNDWNVDKNDDHGSNLNKINCRSLGKMASQNMCLLPNWPPALNHHWSTCKQSLDLQLIISLILSPNFRISKYLKELRKCTHQLITNNDKNYRIHERFWQMLSSSGKLRRTWTPTTTITKKKEAEKRTVFSRGGWRSS